MNDIKSKINIVDVYCRKPGFRMRITGNCTGDSTTMYY